VSNPLRGQLARSARAGGVVDQTLFAAKKQHAFLKKTSSRKGTKAQREQEQSLNTLRLCAFA
jgi:hypothetical protein